jgi:hypothetical protein
MLNRVEIYWFDDPYKRTPYYASSLFIYLKERAEWAARIEQDQDLALVLSIARDECIERGLLTEQMEEEEVARRRVKDEANRR